MKRASLLNSVVFNYFAQKQYLDNSGRKSFGSDWLSAGTLHFKNAHTCDRQEIIPKLENVTRLTGGLYIKKLIDKKR